MKSMKTGIWFTTVLLWMVVTTAQALAPRIAYPGDRTYGHARCHFVRAYDGDTIIVDIPEFPDIAGDKIGVRIAGIDTPEIRGTSGQEKELARNAKRLTESLCRKAGKLELRNIRRDKYFRLLADVYADDVNVAEILIKNGLAKPYDGGKKTGW